MSSVGATTCHAILVTNERIIYSRTLYLDALCCQTTACKATCLSWQLYVMQSLSDATIELSSAGHAVCLYLDDHCTLRSTISWKKLRVSLVIIVFIQIINSPISPIAISRSRMFPTILNIKFLLLNPWFWHDRRQTRLNHSLHHLLHFLVRILVMAELQVNVSNSLVKLTGNMRHMTPDPPFTNNKLNVIIFSFIMRREFFHNSHITVNKITHKITRYYIGKR